jgi:hypothetical protein
MGGLRQLSLSVSGIINMNKFAFEQFDRRL